ncbi:MAG: hypothetical protein J7K73_03625 [Nanoarchaeota archaeon]|nr:hypothetical protein [Nanoarchaeota archaeon]
MGKKKENPLEPEIKSLEEGLFNPTDDDAFPPLIDAIENIGDVKNYLKWMQQEYNRKIMSLEEEVREHGDELISVLTEVSSLRESVETLGMVVKDELPKYMERVDSNAREISKVYKEVEEIAKTLTARLEAIEASISVISSSKSETPTYKPEKEYEGRIISYLKNGRETRGVIPGEPYSVIVKFGDNSYSGPVEVDFELEGKSELVLKTRSEAENGRAFCEDVFVLPKGYKLKSVKIIVTNE